MIAKFFILNSAEPRYVNTSILLRKALYLVALVLIVINLPVAEQFYGTQTFINYFHFYGNPLKWLAQCLNYSWLAPYWKFFVGAHILFLTMGLMGIFMRITPLLIYVTHLILMYKTIDITNGGVQLLNLLLFYQLFFIEKRIKKHLYWQNFMANLAFIACGLQVVFLYAIAGYSKLFGTYWISGEAFYFVSQIPEYSNPTMAQIIKNNAWLSLPISWFVLGYQLLFPLVIWLKKWKPIWLFLGVMFHLGIAFCSGIFDFGIIMLASYVAFLSEKNATYFINFWRDWYQKMGNKIINANGD